MAHDPEQTEKRGRLIFDAEDADLINAAINLRASKRSSVEHRKVSKSEVGVAALREAFSEEIAELRRYMETDAAKKHKKK